LVKKDGLPELAEKIYQDLRFDFNVFIEDKDSIGKRYRRMDALGTPFCVTVDHDILTNGDVTLRYRDSMEQERISIEKLAEIIRNQTSMNNLLKSL